MSCSSYSIWRGWSFSGRNCPTDKIFLFLINKTIQKAVKRKKEDLLTDLNTFEDAPFVFDVFPKGMSWSRWVLHGGNNLISSFGPENKDFDLVSKTSINCENDENDEKLTINTRRVF